MYFKGLPSMAASELQGAIHHITRHSRNWRMMHVVGTLRECPERYTPSLIWGHKEGSCYSEKTNNAYYACRTFSGGWM